MRSLLFLLLGTLSLPATPDHSLAVKEQIFGTNSHSYATLRIEHDNLCSYFDSQTTIFLDEFSKSDPELKPISSRMITQTSSSIHPDANPKDPDAVKTVTKEKDDTTILSELLLEYTPGTLSSWNDEMLSRLSSNKQGGIFFDDKLNLVWGGTVSERLFGDRNSDQDWKIESVSEDQNCIFIFVQSTNGDTNPATKIIPLDERKTRQVRAWAHRQDVYLSLGFHETLEKAVEAASALKLAAHNAKLHGFTPEVWSMKLQTDATVYHIVEADSRLAIKSNAVQTWRGTLDTDPIPIDGEKLLERFEVESR